jgi:hypothetical protein
MNCHASKKHGLLNAFPKQIDYMEVKIAHPAKSRKEG